MNKIYAAGLMATLFSALPLQASAHIVLEHKQAVAGSHYKAVFKIGHGCTGSATTGIRVWVPEGVQGAKPMPKPGWSLDVRRVRLTTPHVLHGKTVQEDVSELDWKVNPELGGQPLPDGQYDEFVMQVQLPSRPGSLAFRVLQTCESGQMDWSEVPATAKPGERLKYPAPVLKLLPSGHEHHAH